MLSILAGVALLGAVGVQGAGAELVPPRPIGVAPAYHPVAGVVSGRPIGGLHCTSAEVRRYGIHLELFAHRRVVLVPPGIGIAGGVRRGAYVDGGRCSYPVRTREPTGVAEVTAGKRLRLGDLFAVWGQPLSATRLAGFRGRVSAFVAGRAWHGDPRLIPLTRHAQIVLEVGGYVRPHRSYLFPRGL